MKILYAVQATGNGHIARAKEILPYLKKYGEVDVFLSGSNCHLPVDLPIRFRSKGLSLFYAPMGKLDYWKIAKELQIGKAIQEARSLPVDKYDLVINDFESITSLACKIRGKASIGFGHQASFQSTLTPRPEKKDRLGEMILRYYGWAQEYVGLHFDSYDTDIYNPIIKEQILQANPVDKGHITVYLPHYGLQEIQKQLKKIDGIRFEIFSPHVQSPFSEGNCFYYPVNNAAFTTSMIESTGVITGAGFETPAETLYLGKKLLALPIRGQYEQLCNAAALTKRNIPVLHKMDHTFCDQVSNWLSAPNPVQLALTHSTDQLIRLVVEKGYAIAKSENYQENFSTLATGI
jgi:uncharacterized protein (TIGR00661 family)